MPKTSRYHNLPNSQLADHFGQAAEASRSHRYLRQEILNRNITTLSGEHFVVFVSEKPSTIFNHDLCRQLLGDDAYNALWQTTPTSWVQAARLVSDNDDDSA